MSSLPARPSELFDLTGRVAVITGGTRGLGWSIAQGFLAAGAKVVVASRDAESVASAERLLKGQGGEALGVVAHIGKLDHIAHLVEKTVVRFGGIDILINNAANPLSLPIGEHAAEAWTKSHDVNLRGPVFLTEAALPYLRKSSSGVVINVLSVGAFMYSPDTAMYCGSKAAMLSWTRSLAAALAPSIRVNALAPGAVMTDMMKKAPQETQDRMGAAGLLGRSADPSEMVGPALFLATEASSFMTGQVLVVDGGLTPGLAI